MGGVHGRIQLRRHLLAPGNFRLSPATGSLLTVPGDADCSRQMLQLAATTAS